MTDSTLQRVWDSRETISRRCDFDSHKLVQFYQSRQMTQDRTKKPTAPAVPTGTGAPCIERKGLEAGVPRERKRDRPAVKDF
ncbi:MAG: hypothetical protein ACI9X0_002278 [Kiritimatiellia bacterium]|jgi:hypothetical protein